MTDKHRQLADYIQNHPEATACVVDFNRNTDRLLPFDFTIANTELSAADIADTARFSLWVDTKLAHNHARYGIGGYMEYRTLYARSELFDTGATEPRRLHLGMDIWGPAGTPVYAALDGTVHSFQNNDHFGDYGPTIILQHNLDGLTLYSLYGHLNQDCLRNLTEGQAITHGEEIALFGHAAENGSWPPHLHFQLMFDMQGYRGDYPGVCRYSEMETYRQNIPDPDMILKFSETL